MIVPNQRTKRAWLIRCAVGLSIMLPFAAQGQEPPAQKGTEIQWKAAQSAEIRWTPAQRAEIRWTAAQDAEIQRTAALDAEIQPKAAQDVEIQPKAAQSEFKAVARISKQLIDDVVSRREILATVPYHDERVLGFHFQGLIDGRAKLSVDMMTSQGDGIFIVHSQGTAATYARGVLGPVVAMGPGWGSFTSQTVVRFDGRKFSLGDTMPWAVVHGELDRIEFRRGGPVGRAVGHLVRPLGRAMVPHAERQAIPIANRLLVNYVNELGGKIIDRLNKVAPVEKSFTRLFPETKDWEFQMSTDSEFIQAAYGPPGIAAPVLPEHSGRPKDTRLELWLHTTNKEAQALADLTKRPLAKQLVQRYFEATLPELAALTEERTVTAVGPWLVISIGAPKAD